MNLILIENKSKVKFIIKNPRFFINVKEKIKDSVKALSNVKLGGRFNRNVIPKTSESQRRRDKSQNVITIIRRQNIQTDSRPFSAYPLHRTQTLKMSQEKRAPNTAYGRHNFKNMSMNTIKCETTILSDCGFVMSDADKSLRCCLAWDDAKPGALKAIPIEQLTISGS